MPLRRCRALRLLAALLAAAGWLGAAAAVAQIHSSAPDEILVEKRSFGVFGLLQGPRLRWRYHEGDAPGLALRGIDDRDFRLEKSYPAPRTEEPSWFRLRIVVSDELDGTTLFAGFTHLGALEAYLDGQLIHHEGSFGDDLREPDFTWAGAPIPKPLSLESGPHVLAVRYLAPPPPALLPTPPAGFQVHLSQGRPTLTRWLRLEQQRLVISAIVVGMSLAITLLHVMMFLLSGKSRRNLDLALLAGSVLLVQALDGLTRLVSLPASWAGPVDAGFKFGLIAVTISGALFLRLALRMDISSSTRFLQKAGVLASAASIFLPVQTVMVVALLLLSDWLRSILLAVHSRTPGSWLLVLGLGAFLAAAATDIISGLTETPTTTLTGMFLLPAGIVVLLTCMSGYVAMRFTETERLSRKHSREAVRLSRENQRQGAELQEADKQRQMLSELQEAHSQLKQAQSQLVQSEKLASLGLLVAGIAHEINTPLGAIHSTNQTLRLALERLRRSLSQEQVGSSPPLQRALSALERASAVIDTGSSRVQEIVRRLRRFARLDEAERQRADINAGLDDTVALVQHELGKRTLVREYGDVGIVECYPAKLNQVVLNLLINAVQATERDGRIVLRSRREGGNLLIEVEDDGHGISAENLPRIFDPGFTTKGVGVGTGLGLSICYGIAQEHRGSIGVVSSSRSGTCFRMEIPTETAPSSEGPTCQRGAPSGPLPAATTS